MVTDRIIEYFHKYAEEMMPGEQFKFRFELSNNQIFGAVTTYAKGVNPDAIIGIIDDSVKLDGSEGILFSTSAMYFSTVGIPTGAVRNAMLRYCDIVNAHVISNKLSDYFNEMQIDIRNLPYEYYRINNMTIRKGPLCCLLNDISQIALAEPCEPDDKVSMSVVMDYLNRKNEYFATLSEKLEDGKKIKAVKTWITDGFGLTPLHYCIALKQNENAKRMINDTMKYNKELYLTNQPLGIYNYCMSVAMAYDSCDDLSWELYKFFDEPNKLWKQIRKAETGEKVCDKVIEIGSFLFQAMQDYAATAMNKYENALCEYESRIDQYEEENSRRGRDGSISYSQYIANMEKIADARQKIEEKRSAMPGSSYNDADYNDNYIDSPEEYAEEYDTDYSSESSELCEYTEEKKSVQLRMQFMQMHDEYMNDCRNKVDEYRQMGCDVDDSIDPRIPIVVDLLTNSNDLVKKNRYEMKDLAILKIKYKYFTLPMDMIEKYPFIKKYIVK